MHVFSQFKMQNGLLIHDQALSVRGRFGLGQEKTPTPYGAGVHHVVAGGNGRLRSIKSIKDTALAPLALLEQALFSRALA
jgi:hypothetical protein